MTVESYRKQLLIGAIVILVGSIMPWGRVTTVFGTMTINGTEGDGVITIVLGGILLLVALAHKGTPGKLYSVAGVVLALIALYVSGATMLRMGGAAAGIDSEYASAGVGSGVFVTIVGSILAAIGSSKKIADAAPEQDAEVIAPDAGTDVPT